MSRKSIKQETIKEFGKLLYDFSKIGLAVAVLAPLAKGETISLMAIASVLIVVLFGTYIINKGVING